MPHKNPETRRAFERERHRRRAESRRARGMCPRCGKNRPAPERSLCATCLERGREAQRARYAKAREKGSRYGGRDPESRRRMARERNRKRRRERLEAGLCTICGERKPAEGGAVCGICREERRAAERKLYAARKSKGFCGRCGGAVFDRASTCAKCAARDAKRRPKKNAASRKRYRERRALKICVDCQAPTDGGVRCAPCAVRSYHSSGEHKGMPVFPARYTIVELETGIEHGPFDSWAEVAMCLAFKRLSRDEIEVVGESSWMTTLTGAARAVGGS